MLIDPQSAYAQNGAYAMGRAMDDEIISAFFGTAKTGEDGSTSTTFPAGNQVAVNFGSASNVGLTVSKLREAKRLLMSAEVDIDNDPLFCVVTSGEHDDMLNEVQATSLDYNTRPTLVDGKITAFMGFNFIHCERLALDGSSYRRVPVFAKSGMHLGIWNDITTSIDRRADKSNAMQVYCKVTCGATRLEEGKVIEIKCA